MAAKKAKANVPETSRDIYVAFIGLGATRHHSEAERRLARYCDAVALGQRPNAADERLIAKALEVLLVGHGPFTARATQMGKALRLIRKQGKGRSAEADTGRLASAVVEYRRLLETQGEAEAKRQVAQRYNITVRALELRITKYADEADHLEEVDRLLVEAGALIAEGLRSEKEK